MSRINFYKYLLSVLVFTSSTAYSQETSYPEVKNNPNLLKENIVEQKNKEALPSETLDYSTKVIKDFNMHLKTVNIKGNSAIMTKDLQKFYVNYLDKKIGYTELVSILDSISKEYRNRGYFLSYVLPEQNFISDNTVNIRIIEGSIKVHILDDFKENKLLKKYVANIEDCKPITQAVYERNIELMKKIPGLEYTSKAQINQQSIKERSNQILDLYILSDKNDVEGLVFIDNTNKNKNQPSFSLWNINSLNNLFDKNEVIKISFETSGSFSKRSDVQVALNIPINDNGADFAATVGKKHVSNSQQIAIISTALNSQPVIFQDGVDTDKQYLDLKLSNSPILSFTKRLITSIGYSLDKLTNKKIVNKQDISKYTTPKLYLEANYYFRDRFKGDNYFNTKIAYSSKSLGGKNYVGQDKFKDFKIVSFNFARRDSFKNDIVSIFQTDTQLTNDSLLGSEKFAYGGWNYGKAYNAPIIVGDQGINASLKLLKLFYKQNSKQIYLLTPYIYADLGVVKNKNDTKKYSASSFGAGLEVFMHNGMKFNYSLNKPITFKNVSDIKKSKINHVMTLIMEYKF